MLSWAGGGFPWLAQTPCGDQDIPVQQAIANRKRAITPIVQQMRQTLDLETIFSLS